MYLHDPRRCVRFKEMHFSPSNPAPGCKVCKFVQPWKKIFSGKKLKLSPEQTIFKGGHWVKFKVITIWLHKANLIISINFLHLYSQLISFPSLGIFVKVTNYFDYIKVNWKGGALLLLKPAITQNSFNTSKYNIHFIAPHLLNLATGFFSY